MTAWARISDGIVVEVTMVDPGGRFHPDIIWIEVPEGTVQGATENGDGIFTSPPVPPAPPPPVARPPVLAVTELLARFMAAELAGVKTSADPDIAAGWAVISDPRTASVDLGSNLITSWFAVLVSKGNLSVDRSAAICCEA